MRRLALLPALAALVLAVVGGAPAAGPPAPSVYPSPGTLTASPRTQISFRGVSPGALGAVNVVGSRSGRHAGALRPHPDGDGASFVPAVPFRSAERVTVRAAALPHPVVFQVAHAAPRRRIHYEIDFGGRPVGAQLFKTLPGVEPPSLEVTTSSPRAAAGDVFVAAKRGRGQDGPLIYDANGGLVWFDHLHRGHSAYDFRVQRYRSQPVLTWWEGRVFKPGQGHGQGVILDSSYQPVARVRAGNGYSADLHEFQLTPRGTAYLLAYNPVRWGRSLVIDGIVQEVDVQTGLVLFEWHSLGHVAVGESYARPHRGEAFDYFHVNSVDEAPDGNLLVSARNTNAVYEIDRRTGAVLWRLGGKRSSFRMGRGTRFLAQHDARLSGDGKVTIFDNAAPPVTRRSSRAIELALDSRRHAASLMRSLVHHPRVVAESQGGVQTLANGDLFVGWGGASPYVSEYASDGTLVFDAHFVPMSDDSYRAYRLPWSGRPAAPPDIAASGRTVWASWNGATDVATWQVLAGQDRGALQPVASAPRAGFETAISLPSAPRYVAVRALDASGAVLGTSRTTTPGT